MGENTASSHCNNIMIATFMQNVQHITNTIIQNISNNNNNGIDNNNHNNKLQGGTTMNAVQRSNDSPTSKQQQLCRIVAEAIHTNDDLLLDILTYLDVVSLLDKKRVCSRWKDLCIKAIESKLGSKKLFMTKQELRTVVVQYVNGHNRDNAWAMEEIAATYGYPIGTWDVSRIDNFSCLFSGLKTFDEDISQWDVSNATNMEEMFWYAESFNQNIFRTWDVSNVTNMNRMFACAHAFNNGRRRRNRSSSRPDHTDKNNGNKQKCRCCWDVSNVTTMDYMFYNATSFSGGGDDDDENVAAWDVSNVTSMKNMFCNATSFNGNVSNWDISRVRDMEGMFQNARRFNRDLSQWNVVVVNNDSTTTTTTTNVKEMLFGAISFRGKDYLPSSWKNREDILREIF